MSDHGPEPRHAEPGGSAAYIAETMVRCRSLALADGHVMLGYLIDMVRAEAMALGAQETGERPTGSRDGRGRPPLPQVGT